MSSYKPRYTAVVVGRKPGVYANWEEARRQTDNFPRAVWRSFPTHFAAAGWLKSQSRQLGVNPDYAERSTAEIVTGKKKQPLGPKRSLVTLSDDEDEPVMKNGRWSRVEEDINLSPQQQEVLERIMKGENIFFTGAAGTGKSHLFRAIIQVLRRSVGKKVAVTASTGMAAINVGGSTLHSWARIGLGTKPVQDLVRNIMKNKGSVDAWRKTDTLLVDEISMISAELLDKLDQIGKRVRLSDAPFGGIQVIFCGDFFQLPPVQDRQGPQAKYAFESNVWDRAFPRTNMVTLEQVFRQAEENLVTALEQIRRGTVSAEASALLTRCNRPVKCPEGTRPVQLYSRRFQVEKENNDSLAALRGEEHVFTAVDYGGKTSNGYDVSPEQATRTLNNSTRWPEKVTLKIGAQVMLVHNWSQGLVNGSTGKVVKFSTMAEFDSNSNNAGDSDPEMEYRQLESKQLYPVVDFEARNGLKHPPVLVPIMEVKVENAAGKMEACRRQIPLMLAWAITIHKAQGMTLSRVKVDLQGTFDVGQAYVALSRATTLEGLELRGFNSRRIMVSPRVLQWAEEQQEDDEFDDWFLQNAAELDAQLSSQAIPSQA